MLRIKENMNPYFLFSSINNKQSYFKKHGAGSSQLNISKGVVENLKVEIPNINEQNRIAAFFEKLDILITLHQRKLYRLS